MNLLIILYSLFGQNNTIDLRQPGCAGKLFLIRSPRTGGARQQMHRSTLALPALPVLVALAALAPGSSICAIFAHAARRCDGTNADGVVAGEFRAGSKLPLCSSS